MEISAAPKYATTATSKEPKDLEEAAQILLEIQDSKGHQDESFREWLGNAPPQHNKKVNLVFRKYHKEQAKSLKTATNSNSSNTHFIDELIQNADDAKYAEGKLPSIEFFITKDRIVVETNEDGFSRENVEAICETGESSKKADSPYRHIGEKGIGFKSIFRVAEEVHIASGYWHFRFRYRGKGDELGMVTPLLNDKVQLPKGVGTRLTIKLNADHRRNIGRIINGFEDLPDTVIFFLQKLRRMKITIELDNLRKSKSVERDILPVRGRTRLLEITNHALPLPSIPEARVEKYYEVYSDMLNDMPNDSRRSSTEANVILAFPIDIYDRTSQPVSFHFDGHGSGIANTLFSTTREKEPGESVNAYQTMNSWPPLSGQPTARLHPRGEHIFAFLPVSRMVQVKFLIQGDFITTTNRESLEECEWNERLVEAVADAFCSAVAYFCEFGTMRFEWPKYVPSQPIDGHFSNLQERIIGGLRSKRVLCTLTSRTLRLPTQLRKVPHYFKLDHLPLLADRTGEHEIYLATEYEAYPALLTQLRVQKVSQKQILHRLKDDLVDGLRSKTKGLFTSKEWHEALASLLLCIYSDSKLQELEEYLENMDIIPLASGKWSKAPSKRPKQKQIYFPTIDDVRVPTSLGIDLVDTLAVTSAKRVLLFQKMGVRHSTVEYVSTKIKMLHKAVIPPRTAQDAVDDLYFYYRFNLDVGSNDWSFWVYTSNGNAVRSENELYLPSKARYSADRLSQNLVKLDSSKADLHSGWLLHWYYLSDRLPDRLPDRFGTRLGWKDWLDQEVGIGEFPRLTTWNDKHEEKLSSVLVTVLSASSELFLNVLQAHWRNIYASIYRGSSSTKALLLQCLVKCHGKVDYPLGETYLPCQEIIERAEEIGVSQDCKILKLTLSDKAFVMDEWTCLKDLGLRSTVDVQFHLQALHTLQSRDKPNRADLIYAYIGAHAQRKQKDKLIKEFATHKLLYVPCTSDHGSSWFSSGQCVWEGPPVLSVKKSLANHYSHDKDATYLFRSLLDLPNASWEDLIEQLKVNKESGNANFGEVHASEIYTELKSMSSVNWEKVRFAFSRDQLVYVSGAWYSRNKCLWTSELEIKGRPVLAKVSAYRFLEEFFTEDLKIKKASVEHFVSELIKMANERNGLDIEKAKVFLIQISNMLPPQIEDGSRLQQLLGDLLERKVLPIRRCDGVYTLVSGSSEFVIRDHHEYSRIFAASCTFLDFTFDEVPQITRLLDALDLDMYNISRLVDEEPASKEGAAFNDNLTEAFQRKAPCLFSCAYKYGSSRATRSDRSLLEELQTIQIYTCSKITTQLTLDLDGVEPVQRSDKTQMVLEMNSGRMSLYIPRTVRSQRLIFRHHLPDELLSLMFPDEDSPGTSYDGAKLAISSILVSPLSDMDDVMKIENLPKVPWLSVGDYDFSSDPTSPELEEKEQQEEEEKEDEEEEKEDEEEEQEEQEEGEEDHDEYEHDSGHLEHRNERSEEVLRSAFARASISSPSSRPSTAVFTPSSPVFSGYVSLLNHVINCASSEYGATTLRRVRPASLSLSDVFVGESRRRSNREQNNMVGAAGELYVFELLRGLKLPDFGIDNWQSRCREYVLGHPRYAEVQPWQGERETADIVYDDASGKLGSWLLRTSCNGFPRFDDRTISQSEIRCKYLIEVKTTTDRNCDSDFHMSNSGYRLMNKWKVDPAKVPEQIYVIIRVFDLLTENIGFKVFVDPCRSRDDGEHPLLRPALQFRGDTWRVRPYTSPRSAL